MYVRYKNCEIKNITSENKKKKSVEVSFVSARLVDTQQNSRINCALFSFFVPQLSFFLAISGFNQLHLAFTNKLPTFEGTVSRGSPMSVLEAFSMKVKSNYKQENTVMH